MPDKLAASLINARFYVSRNLLVSEKASSPASSIKSTGLSSPNNPPITPHKDASHARPLTIPLAPIVSALPSLLPPPHGPPCSAPGDGARACWPSPGEGRGNGRGDGKEMVEKEEKEASKRGKNGGNGVEKEEDIDGTVAGWARVGQSCWCWNLAWKEKLPLMSTASCLSFCPSFTRSLLHLCASHRTYHYQDEGQVWPEKRRVVASHPSEKAHYNSCPKLYRHAHRYLPPWLTTHKHSTPSRPSHSTHRPLS